MKVVKTYGETSFIEKTYIVCTHWNCLIEAIPTYVTENKDENYLESIMSIVFNSFKHHN